MTLSNRKCQFLYKKRVGRFFYGVIIKTGQFLKNCPVLFDYPKIFFLPKSIAPNSPPLTTSNAIHRNRLL